MAERRIRRRRKDRHAGPLEMKARDLLKQVGYCHLCDCKLGWLHNATEKVGVEYVPHEPFLEDDCETCWASLASTTYSLLKDIPPPS